MQKNKKIAVVTNSYQNYLKILKEKNLNPTNCVFIDTTNKIRGLEISQIFFDQADSIPLDINMEICKAQIR